MKGIARILIVISCTIAITSCKQEGCTDPDALNYNVVADDDDGSCQYCSDNLPEQLGYSDYELVDDRSWSPYFNQAIVRVETTQKEIQFNFSECGQSACYFDVKVENIIDENISFLQFNMSLQTVNGFSYGINQWESLNIEVGKDTLITGIVVSVAPQQCSPILGNAGVFGNVNSAEFD